MQDFRALRVMRVHPVHHLPEVPELIRTVFIMNLHPENMAAVEEVEVQEIAEAEMEKADSPDLSQKLLCSKLVFENRTCLTVRISVLSVYVGIVFLW